MAKYCSYSGCQTGRDASRAKCKRLGVRQLSVFKVPKNMVQRWSRAIGECLSHTDFVCELHFSNDSIIKEDRIKMPTNADGMIEVIPHLRHTLIADAMPIAVHNKENGGQPEQNVPCDQLAGPSHGSVAICNDAVVHQVPTTCSAQWAVIPKRLNFEMVYGMMTRYVLYGMKRPKQQWSNCAA